MGLPAMPYNIQSQKAQTTSFGGVNIRDDAAEREFLDCRNLAFDAYPSLSPRAGRGVYGEYSAPSDIFEWDGHVVVADGTTLLYDGNIVGTVKTGEKQFAVVNTKLIVWPDKVYVDINSEEFGKLEDGVYSAAGVPSVTTSSSITPGEGNIVERGEEQVALTGYHPSYGTSSTALRCWVYSDLVWADGAWQGTGEEKQFNHSNIGQMTGKFVKLRAGEVNGVYRLNYRRELTYATNAVLTEYSDDLPELCAVITDAKLIYLTDGSQSYHVTFDVLNMAENVRPLNKVFSVGDRVQITGNPFADPKERYEIVSIDDHTLHFAEGAFSWIPSKYTVIPEDWEGGEIVYTWEPLTEQGVFAIYYVDVPAKYAGMTLYCKQRIYESSCRVWDGEQLIGLQVKSRYDTNVPTTVTWVEGTGISVHEMDITRALPDMDFIASHANRLYGVANRTQTRIKNEDTGEYEEYTSRVIYVSALGLPTRFYDFEGVDTDSYSVAESSNGDFTAVVEYGDYVLFFKEHKVLKFYGDYPSQMGYTYDDIEGVKTGCHKSCVIVNNVLYYAGLQGYYAYGGATPELISYKIGAGWDNARAGTDGSSIWLFGYRNGNPEMWRYSLVVGAWMREDELEVKGFALVGGKVHILAGNTVWVTEGGDETVEWEAAFHPLTENTFRRKAWKYLRLRAECEPGATITVLVKIGDREIERLFSAATEGWHTFTVPLPLMRVDRMSVLLRGSGGIKIRAIEREFQVGSEF